MATIVKAKELSADHVGSALKVVNSRTPGAWGGYRALTEVIHDIHGVLITVSPSSGSTSLPPETEIEVTSVAEAFLDGGLG